jgi:tetratricopeptide (TPR) repeat protein
MTEPATSAQLIQQGLFHHRQGDIKLAMDRYTEALRNDPDNAEALYYVAVVSCQQGQFQQGADLARRVIAKGPPQACAHNLLGRALEQLDDPLEAIKSYDKAISIDANFAEAHSNRATLLAKAALPDEALKSYDCALALDPKSTADWINRGALLQDVGRHEEALASYDKALALTPQDAGILMNRANALSMLGRFPEAEAVYDEVIRRNPKLQIAFTHKGLAVKHQGRFADARKLLEQALTMQKEDAGTAFALGQLTLLTGDWRTGFPLFERRVAMPKPAYVPLEFPRWQGQPPGDFRLVILSEQGLGDTVHFGRYASLLAGRGHSVTLLTQPVLAPLMRTLPGIEKVVTADEELSGDTRRILWSPLMSLMGALHLMPNAIPVQEPYLSAEPARAAQWAERLGRNGFKVGVFWQGNTRASAAPLATLAPLAEVPGVRLISLQKGPAGAETAHVPFGARIERPLDASDLSREALLETAALIRNLDLVVSIDSMPAHLAGALGRPVFLALPYVADWRWLSERDDTPWYPATKLFRQDQMRDWTAVFERIAAAVRERVSAKSDISASQN